MINELLLQFGQWMEAQQYSQMLVAGYYSYSWLEATHVLTLMVSIGSLFIIDFRMLGWILPNVSASTIAERLHKPMMIGFAVMFITGFLLVYAKPVETIQSLWFRIKMILLVLAFINAWVFNAKMKAAGGSWDNDSVAPRGLRTGAILSLVLWCGVVTMGRYIPYDWVDCDKTQNPTILWAAGCVDQLKVL
ncbi:MAG: putative membrane protein [Pseudohongiellaceae bacterium]